MKKTVLSIGSLVAVVLLFSSCGDNDMVNGAKAHGENIGKQTCECSKVSWTDEMQACADELTFLVENYKAFLSTAQGEGSDMDELKKVYYEAFEEASKSCE